MVQVKDELYMKDNKQYSKVFAQYFFLIGILLAIIMTFTQLGLLRANGFWIKLIWLASTVAIIGITALIHYYLVYSEFGMRILQSQIAATKLELVSACLLLLIGTILRWLVIRLFHVQPSSDFATYYGIADLLSRNRLLEEGAWYCEYISFFPHVLGYPSVLSIIFRLFGASIQIALYFNLLLQMLTCILVWRIARKLKGRVSGLIALTFSVLMPSTILYSSIMGGEALYTFLLLSAAWLFVHYIHLRKQSISHAGQEICILLVFGLTLSLASFIRPMGIIFLIAAVVCIFTINTINRNQNHPSDAKKKFFVCLTNRRWKHAVILVSIYFLGSFLNSSWTEQSIQRAAVGTSASFGFNLMVGLNPKSFGAWNAEDSAFLQQSLDATGTAQGAQEACRDLAFERLSNVSVLPGLFMAKFAALWGDDKFGSSWNMSFLTTQGELTSDQNDFLMFMQDISDMLYLLLLVGVGIYGWYMLRKKADSGYVIMLYICGTMALHLLVEVQNRYHYPVLLLMCILSGIGFRQLICQISATIKKKLNQ